MKLSRVKQLVSAETVYGEDLMDVQVEAACASDLMSDVLAFADPGQLLVSGLTNPQVIRTAEMVNAAAVCLVRGKRPVEGTLELAREERIPVLCTELCMYTTCGRLAEAGLPGCGDQPEA